MGIITIVEMYVVVGIMLSIFVCVFTYNTINQTFFSFHGY
jgi:hypothetical protein